MPAGLCLLNSRAGDEGRRNGRRPEHGSAALRYFRAIRSDAMDRLDHFPRIWCPCNKLPPLIFDVLKTNDKSTMPQTSSAPSASRSSRHYMPRTLPGPACATRRSRKRQRWRTLAALGAICDRWPSKTKTRIASARIMAAAGRGAAVATFITDLVAGLGVQIGRRGAGPPKLDDHLGRCPRLRRAACGRKKEGLDRRRGLNARTQYASFGSA
jgi:hypothetical protein